MSTQYYAVARPAGRAGFYGKVAVLVAVGAVGGFLARGVEAPRIEVGQPAAVRSVELPAMDASLGFWDVIDARPATPPAVEELWYSGQSGNGLSIAENQSDYGSATLGAPAASTLAPQSEMGDFQFAPAGAAVGGTTPFDEQRSMDVPTAWLANGPSSDDLRDAPTAVESAVASTQQGPAAVDGRLAEAPPADPLWNLREQLDFRS